MTSQLHAADPMAGSQASAPSNSKMRGTCMRLGSTGGLGFRGCMEVPAGSGGGERVGSEGGFGSCLGSLSAFFDPATEDPDGDVGRPVEVEPG